MLALRPPLLSIRTCIRITVDIHFHLKLNGMKKTDFMNVRILGSAHKTRTIILAHGYGADQSLWDDVLPTFATRYTVALFDWCFSPAVTDSTLFQRNSSLDDFADELICVVEEMKLKSPPIVVGHSVSGIISCIAAVKRPDLFHTLILVGATPRLLNEEGYEGGFDKTQVEEIFSGISSNFDEWCSQFAAMVVDGPGTISTHKFHNSIKKMRPLEVALPLAETIFLADYRHILPAVITPCHIICTRNDVVVPHSVSVYMQTKLNQGESEIHVIDTEGHFPHLTSPIQFVETIDAIIVNCNYEL